MDINKEIVAIINNNLSLPHYKVFLFGSRANAKAHNRSDYDVGIEAAKEIPLYVLHEIKHQLDELPLLQQFDVVDFNQVSDDFKEIALKDIEVIYEK